MITWNYYRDINGTAFRFSGTYWETWIPQVGHWTLGSPKDHDLTSVPTEYEAIHGRPEAVDAAQSDERPADDPGAVDGTCRRLVNTSEEAKKILDWWEREKKTIYNEQTLREVEKSRADRAEQEKLLARFTAAALTGLLAAGDEGPKPEGVPDIATKLAKATLEAYNREIQT